MKRKLIISILLVMACLSASAYDFMVDGIAYKKNSDGNSVTVTYTILRSTSNYDGGIGTLTIPEKVTYNNETYIVTSIGNCAFQHCSGFTGELKIPNSVTSIGEDAFFGCKGFTGALTIPNSVTIIGEAAFDGCSGFSGELNIPNSVTAIGKYAFSRCSGLTGALNIPNSVTTIGNRAFYNCSGFTGSLTIPNSIKTINDEVFSGCSGLTGTLTIPNSVTSIGYYAFSGCSGFTGPLTIPNSVISINYRAFYNCSGFTGELVIPEGVTTIKEHTFYNCSKIEKLTIGQSVESIAAYAFSEMKSLKTVIAIPTTPIEIESSVFFLVYKGNSILYVPLGSESLYATANVWKDFGTIKTIRKFGDVNGDNEVNASDITALISMVLGETEIDLEVCDINGDGCVDVSDVTSLISLILSQD